MAMPKVKAATMPTDAWTEPAPEQVVDRLYPLVVPLVVVPLVAAAAAPPHEVVAEAAEAAEDGEELDGDEFTSTPPKTEGGFETLVPLEAAW